MTIILADNSTKISNKWFKPSKDSCIKYGGKYDSQLPKFHQCETKSYKNAISICKADNKRLIKRIDAKTFVENCGGTLYTKDLTTKGYVSCVFKAGFVGGYALLANNKLLNLLNGFIEDPSEIKKIQKKNILWYVL